MQTSAPGSAVIHHVYVTVSGGVAYIAQAPKGVEVHILDYDNLKADFDATFSKFSREEREFYRSNDL